MGADVVASTGQEKYTIKNCVSAALEITWDSVLGTEHVPPTLFSGIPLFLGLCNHRAQICLEGLCSENEIPGPPAQGSAAQLSSCDIIFQHHLSYSICVSVKKLKFAEDGAHSASSCISTHMQCSWSKGSSITFLQTPQEHRIHKDILQILFAINKLYSWPCTAK